MDPEPTFEAALGQLERIADDLERGEADLTVALAKYEEAIRLLTHCHGQVDAAERIVALLTDVDEAGRPVTAPFDATATAERDPAPAVEPTRPPAARSARNPRPPARDQDDDSIPF